MALAFAAFQFYSSDPERPTECLKVVEAVAEAVEVHGGTAEVIFWYDFVFKK